MKHLERFESFIVEGVKLDDSGRAILSRKNDPDDLMKFVDGKTVLTSAGGFKVMYRLESKNSQLDKVQLKSAMDSLKSADPEKFLNMEQALAEFMKPDLMELKQKAKSSNSIDYIIKIGSTQGLASAMVASAKKVFPSAKVVEIPKIVHKTFFTAVDYDAIIDSMKNFKESSFEIVKTFVLSKIDKEKTDPSEYEKIKSSTGPLRLASELEIAERSNSITWAEGFTDFKVRKTHTVPGNITRFFKKYEISDSDFINAVSDCVKNQKNAIILDDNIHSGTDMRLIFKTIGVQSRSVVNTIRSMEMAKMAVPGLADKLEASLKNRFVGYVLYRIKDSDL